MYKSGKWLDQKYTEVKIMNIRKCLLCLTFTLLIILFVSAFAFGQEMSASWGRNVADMKFMNIPPLPTCARGSVQSGDPSKGPAIIFLRTAVGCVIPWHWHTAAERVAFVYGTARIEMKGNDAMTLRPGGFVTLMSKHPHQFTCKTGPCQLYVYPDAAFDLHYVDVRGNEITPDEALKAVGETGVVIR